MGLVIPWTNNELNFLKENYNKMTSKEMSNFINRTKTAIDIKINRLGLTKKKYYFSSDFFKKIDSSEKAYWLGFIYADGYVSDTELAIELQQRDKDHLKKFNKSLKGNMEVSLFDKKNNLSEKMYGMCKIRVYCTNMVRDLNEWGVFRNKSLSIEYPEIEKEFDSHFIRGFFDGDGCLSRRSQKSKNFTHYSIQADFTCGSIKFLEKLREVLHLENIKSYICSEKTNTYRLRIGGMKNTDCFLNYIYKNTHESMHLDRKYNKKLHLYKELNIEQRLLLHAEKHAKRRSKRERKLEG